MNQSKLYRLSIALLASVLVSVTIALWCTTARLHRAEAEREAIRAQYQNSLQERTMANQLAMVQAMQRENVMQMNAVLSAQLRHIVTVRMLPASQPVRK